jgi:hypothetical protein
VSESILLLFATSLLGLSGASILLRHRSLSLADVFLFSIAVYFGGYTLIDIVVVGVRGLDPSIITAVYVGIGCCALMLWLFARFGPRWIVEETSLMKLTRDWKACPGALIVAMVIGVVVFRVYAVRVVGSYGAESQREFEAIDQRLPYWFTAIGMLAPAVLFTAGIASWAKFMTSARLDRALWLGLAVVTAGLLFWLGRRPIFAFLVVAFWLIATIGQASVRRWVVLFVVSAIAAPFLVSVSNLFQSYRLASYRGVPVVSALRYENLDSLIQRASSIEKTVANLQDRQAVWRFNYAVVNSHQRGEGALQWGRLLVRAVPNYIPAVLYPGKKIIFETEGELQRAMNLEYRDAGENIFVMTYGDFGLVSFLIAPLMIILFVTICAMVLRRFSDPFLRILLMGMCLYYALNMEAQYTTPIAITRDFLVLALVYLVIRNGWRISFGMAKDAIAVLRAQHASRA